MSSTLYNRGTTTQTGVRRRAEAIDKSITELRAAVSASDETARLVRLLESRVAAMERKIAALEATNATLGSRTAATATATATEAVPTLEVTATTTNA